MADIGRPEGRPRSKSVLSFGSHKSKDSVPKIDLTETEKEKSARRIKGKADPSAALKELQPSARAQETSTMIPLRSMQHRDATGNLIADPDRSNPTRPRMERPLDTIRSFEAAIDGSYSKRQSLQPDMQSRRSSYYHAINGAPRSSGPPSYYDRQTESRPQSIYDHQHQGPGYYGSAQQRRYPPRHNSDPILYGSNGVSNSNGIMQPQHAHQLSYDAATASTSNSYMTDQGTVSTVPSSHNSSFGELPKPNGAVTPHHQQQMPEETYGMNFGAGVPPILEDEYGQPLPAFQPQSNGMARHSGYQTSGGYQNGGYQNGTMTQPPPPPPPPPAHSNAMGARKQPISLSSPVAPDNGYKGPPRPPPAEKRKSWLGRRFSRNA